MMRALSNTIAAELLKLRGHPSACAAILSTVAASIALPAALAASGPITANALQITLLSVPFLQIGAILVGVLTVGGVQRPTDSHYLDRDPPRDHC